MSADTVRTAFRDQARACRMLDLPLTATLCDMLAEALQPDQGAVARRVLDWTGDPSVRADSLPLRLCGALHALVLTGADPALAAAYRAGAPDVDLLLSALAAHQALVLEWLESPPQTNEVARSAAIIAAARFATAQIGLPIRALELGASAGLNLNFHRYHFEIKNKKQSSSSHFTDGVILSPDWSGEVPEAQIEVAEAEGVDLRPLDPRKDGLRLLAYCWADQTARMGRLRAALTIAENHPPRVTAGDAAAWLQKRLEKPSPGRLTMVFHTVAWQYFPPATQADCEAALQAAGDAARPDTPLAHFAMETDGGDGAALTMRLWNGGAQCWSLGRADFHGRWIDWNPRPV